MWEHNITIKWVIAKQHMSLLGELTLFTFGSSNRIL